jgi:hypothetical protein
MTYYSGAGLYESPRYNPLNRNVLLAVNAGTGSVTLEVLVGTAWVVKTVYSADATAQIYVSGGTWRLVIAGNAAFVWGDSNLDTVTDFVMTVATTGANETFTIPCRNVGVFAATVDWGDGTSSVITAFDDVNLAHVYATAENHEIKIAGSFPTIFFSNGGDRLKVKSVLNLGDTGWLTFQSSFFGCASMTSFVAGNTNTSLATSTRSMLRDAPLLAYLDVTNLDTSSVEDMGIMFQGDTSLTDIIGVELFNIEGLDATTSLDNFATSVTMTTARYDAVLLAWDAQNPFDGMSPNFGSSTYTGGGPAAAARANLISTDGWTITDGGLA